ncbi:uridine diphosphate-N-acetylglucosamine-binding protein YvcK [Peptococcus simiae]|uniref:gluconeogenesis factor YvcK family protein n=1 Tax=Peptococcus simiae TaxID=1643805 RepID=UPI003980ACF2
MKPRKRLSKWLSPGLGLKRWAILGGVALGLVVLGLWSMVNNQTAKQFTYDVVHFLQLNLPDLSFWQGLICVFIGIGLILYSSMQVSSRFHSTKGSSIDAYYEETILANGPKIVVIGGGTGLGVLLRGLKKYTSNITAAVTVGDDGGSSGKLREAFDVIPVGDIRNCIVALADEQDIMEKLFSYRFAKGEGLKGHSLGNLLLLGLTAVQGNFQDAVANIDQVLHISGRVLPITMEPLTLVAKMSDGKRIVGECHITDAEAAIAKLSIRPGDAEVLPEVLAAIAEADAIVLGPGSLYTSVLPNLCVKGVTEALAKSRGRVFYVCNVMTQPGETTDYTAADHLRAILDHSQEGLVDYVIADDGTTSPDVALADFITGGGAHVQVDAAGIKKLGADLVTAPLVASDNPYRHASLPLAKTIMETLYNDNYFRLHRGLVKSYWDWQTYKHRKDLDT